MHWKWFLQQNALEMIFTMKMYWKIFLLLKCIGNDFYHKNTLEIIFYSENELESIFIINIP